MPNGEKAVTYTKEECIANMALIGQKMQRCDWVLLNVEDEYRKDQAKKSLKKFRPIYSKLGKLYEEFEK